MIGSFLAMIPNTKVIILGRFIYGFGGGVMCAAGPKIMGETVPDHLIEEGYGVFTNIAINFFIFVAMMLGIGAPTNKDELGESPYW